MIVVYDANTERNEHPDATHWEIRKGEHVYIYNGREVVMIYPRGTWSSITKVNKEVAG